MRLPDDICNPAFENGRAFQKDGYSCQVSSRADDRAFSTTPAIKPGFLAQLFPLGTESLTGGDLPDLRGQGAL